jgi:hypothetical protein
MTADPTAVRQLSTYNAALLGASPVPTGYGYLHTTPYQHAPVVAPVVGGGYPYYGSSMGLIGAGPGVGYGAALQGLAGYTQASGQYWQDIQAARLSREQVRQAQIETSRRRLQFEMEYEKLRPTAGKMIDAERAAELEYARNRATIGDIATGRTFNVLLRSILNTPNPTGGPNLSLDPAIVHALNLTDMSTRANLSLAKDEGKIAWTEALEEAFFDTPRTRFQKNFEAAVKLVNTGTMPERALVQELREDWKALSEKLDDHVREMTPTQYIGSRRLLNQLKDTVAGLANPVVCKACVGSWRKNVHTAAQLVEYCMTHGLGFGPAVATDDERYYMAAYYVLRNYERGVAPSPSQR